MSKWSPSKIENDIYDIMAREEFVKGTDLYTAGLKHAVVDYLNEHGIIFQCMSRVWDDFDGDTTTIAWLENNEVHMIQWEVDYR